MQRLWPPCNFLLAALLAVPAIADTTKDVDEVSAADEACCGCKADEASCEKEKQSKLEATQNVTVVSDLGRLVARTGLSFPTSSSSSPLSDEPRLRPKAEPNHVFPQTEEDLISRRRWPNMPAFQIFPEPLPAPPVQPPAPQFGGVVPDILIWDAKPAKAVREYQVFAAGGPTVTRAKATSAPSPCKCDACPTKANAEALPPTPSTQYSNLTLPTPTADPAQMVVHLFERLKQAEERAAEARRQLAETQVQLAKLRQASTVREKLAVDFAHARSQSSTVSHPQPAPAQVHLAMQVYEIDLDAAKDVDLSEFGVCAARLSRVGLSGLTERGAFIASKTSSCSESCSASCAGEGSSCCTKSKTATCSSLSCIAAKAVAIVSRPCQSEKAQTTVNCIENSQRLQSIVAVLQKSDALKLISCPQVMALSGRDVSVMNHVQVPVAEIAFTARGEGVKAMVLRDVGMKLHILPVVGIANHLQLQVKAEWSTLASDGTSAVHRQTVESVVEVPSGKTAILGSITQLDSAKNTRKEIVLLGTPKIVIKQPKESVANRPER